MNIDVPRWRGRVVQTRRGKHRGVIISQETGRKGGEKSDDNALKEIKGKYNYKVQWL